jgi:hypothetical protein
MPLMMPVDCLVITAGLKGHIPLILMMNLDLTIDRAEALNIFYFS